jgi:hypothetical protein
VTRAASEPSFESLRDDLLAAPPAFSARERSIRWVDVGKTLAFSRDTNGRLELFLVGPPLIAKEAAVRARLVHDTWLGAAGESLPANRIWLPDGDHFDAAAATVLIELLANGYPGDNSEGFHKTEALIALVLTQSEAEGAVLTGLAGEMLTLVALLKDPNAPSPETLLNAWQGWQRSSRDFQLGAVGVEVKTSTTRSGRHHIQGWYQVEPGVSTDGSPEAAFFILSLGIQWLSQEMRGQTIEGLVGQVMTVLPDQAKEEFLDSVRTYGGTRVAIDANGVAGHAGLRRPFVPTYERLYDMSDARIGVPRSNDLAAFKHLVMDTVNFEIQLPERVRGDLNPISGLSAITSTVLAASMK